VTGGVALVVALGAAFFYAWQDGLIPTSVLPAHPRAPLPENFLAALTASPTVTQSLRPACVRLNLHAGRPIDRMGRPGFQYQRVPGWDVLVIAQVPGESGQRIGNLTQALDALAKAGLYTVSDTETDDGAGGTLPAKTYALTLAGWTGMIDDQCFKAGTPQVTEITEFARVMPDRNGKRIYEVKARIAVQSLAPWVDDPAVQAIAGPEQMKRLRESASASFRLLQTDDGWEVERPENDAPELTREAVMALVSAWPGGTPQACIRLPARSGVFDIALAPFAATLYETDTQGAPDARFLMQVLWQGRLAQLVEAGIFAQEKIPADPKRNAPAGTRFVLDPAYQQWLDMNDAGCLRMGEGALELVSLSVQPQPRREGSDQRSATATAKLMLRLAKDAWIEKSALALPEVQAVKAAGGVPVTLRLAWVDREREKGWRLASAQVPSSEPVPPRMPRNLPVASAGAVTAPAPAVPAGPVVAGVAPAGDITWASGGERSTNGRVTNEGLTVTYCCAGASSTTLASRGVGSGKAYAEFTFTARPRALKGDTWTTIGVVPAPAPGRDGRMGMVDVMPGAATMWNQRSNEIAHNDVIGIAIDLDAGQLYFSRNGAWLNGQPGGGGGIPLTRGQAYRIAAVVSASSSSAGTDSWTANFGKTKFRYAIPRGFGSYDGRQRG
jgi:hypothetical protein